MPWLTWPLKRPNCFENATIKCTKTNVLTGNRDVNASWSSNSSLGPPAERWVVLSGALWTTSCRLAELAHLTPSSIFRLVCMLCYSRRLVALSGLVETTTHLIAKDGSKRWKHCFLRHLNCVCRLHNWCAPKHCRNASARNKSVFLFEECSLRQMRLRHVQLWRRDLKLSYFQLFDDCLHDVECMVRYRVLHMCNTDDTEQSMQDVWLWRHIRLDAKMSLTYIPNGDHCR